MRTLPLASWLTLLAPVAALVACGDDAGTGTTDTAVEEIADTAVVEIDAIVFDTQDSDAAPDTAVDSATTTDTTPAETTDTATDTTEVTEGCRTFGCECQTNSDCVDELCVESADGNICTRTCIADCPNGFDCLAVSSGGADPVSMCVPRHVRLCRPCRSDLECDDPGDPYPAYCLPVAGVEPSGASGSFCGSSCANRDCPEGYQCVDAALSGGGSAKQCVPVTGECACRPSWGDLGYSTSCLVRNTFGSCGGTRSCTENGLSGCIGPQATPEVCDLADNDCDGQTDDIEATACAVQNQFGSCPGTLGCDGGAPKCLGPEPQAETCNGLDDNCNAQTDESTCNDGLACTVDACVDASQCTNTLAANNCLVAGTCFSAGQFNPNNFCETCDPAKSTVAFSQSANTCVIAGQCFPANAANPNNACEICNPAQSTTSWTQALNTCNIQGQCFAAFTKNPSNECLVCDPSKSATGWSNAASTTVCDDGNACSASSTCDGAGTCRGDTSCNDGVSCTVDTCNPASGCDNSAVTPGTCRIGGTCYSSNASNPSNTCERCEPNTTQSAWSPQPSSVACNDNLFCTTDDHCDGNRSCVGTPRTCGDPFTCTQDACNENTDSCTNTLQNGNCLITNSCYANNATQPGNVCYKCASGTSTSQWSYNNGAGCDDGNACTSGDTCSGGGCNGSFVLDNYEPNDSVGAARAITNRSDCDDPNSASLTATFFPSGNEDWYRFQTSDDTGCSMYPDVSLSGIAANSNLELEVYFTCKNGESLVSFDCSRGSKVGGNGCRSANPGSSAERVTIDACCTGAGLGIDCSGDDSGYIDIHVYKAGGAADPTCQQPYTLSWGDD